jgi:RHH-type transcriptional regulator, rel operon repressor / antitoxin RelB
MLLAELMLGYKAMAETTLNVPLPAEVGARLERLARDTSISKSKLAKDAIVTYLDDQERQLEKIREGMADAAAGRVVANDEVARWLDSWTSCRHQNAADLDAQGDAGSGPPRP